MTSRFASRRQAFWLAGCLAFLPLSAAFGQTPSPLLLAPGKEVTKAAPAQGMVMRQRPVQVNAAPFQQKSTAAPATFTVELFDGETVLVETARVERRSDTDVTYFGRIRGQPRSEVVLTFVDGHLAADIVVDGRDPRAYRIQSQPGSGHWLQEVDPRAFPPDHPGDDGKLPAVRPDKLGIGKAEGDVALDTGDTIDVLVVYSNQTATAAGTGIGAQIQAAVDRANLAYANSGVAMRLRLVHQESAGYDESGNFSTDLSRLAGSSDGYMDGVHALRNTKGADMVSLFVENGSACGIGYIGPSSGLAFTVVNRGCASGNLSFAHEIGHNFGARHDTYVDASTSPYAYGHGYVNVAAGWRTVMAYNNACSDAGKSCTRLAHLSNPNVSYGTVPAPTGTAASADNARVHNQNAYTVANFRAATSGTTCSYALSPASASVGATAASGATSVTAGSGCAWNASSNAAWLTIGAGSGSSGSGTLNYAATANSGPARSGAISVGGVAFTVSQANGCTYTVTPTSATATAAGGTASLTVTTAAGCTWTAASGASWMSVTGGASGSGNGTVNYSVAGNTGALRTGNLTVAGKTVTVTQSAPATCSYAFSPASASVGAAGASGATSVTAGSGCAWNATSNAAWLTIGAGSGTSGSGTLNYVAAANSGPARSGAISVGGVAFTVAQANGCTYTVSPTSATATAAGGTASVSVTTATGCTWTATSGASWMSVTSGASGAGSGTVNYTVAGNTGAARNGTLTVAGTAVTVTQSEAAVTPTTSASLAPPAMDFGSLQVGRMSVVNGGGYTNTGTTVIAIAALSLGGSHPGDFVARNACQVGQVLLPGESCALGYAFAPKAKGPRSAVATIVSQAGTRTITLSGTGKQAGRN